MGLKIRQPESENTCHATHDGKKSISTFEPPSDFLQILSSKRDDKYSTPLTSEGMWLWQVPLIVIQVGMETIRYSTPALP